MERPGRPIAFGAPRSQLRAAIIVAVAAVSLAFTVVGVPLGIATLDQYGSSGPLFIVMFPAIVLSLTLVGGFVALRVPTNPIGWLLEISGLAAAIGIFGGTYVNYDHATSAGLPLVLPLAWLSSWIFVPAIGLLFVYVPLLFPTGRFLGPRWRALGIVGVVGIGSSFVAALIPGPLAGSPWIENPVGIAGASNVLTLVSTISNVLAPVFFGGAAVSVFVRYRRAGPVERQQLKWFGLVAGIAIVSFVLSIPNAGPFFDIAWEVGIVTIALLPVAIGIAILRYRLWDIDRIVSRTVGWAMVTGILVALFALLVVGLEGLLAGLTQGQTLAVATSTLAASAAFQPLRRRVQHAVDRRFDRASYDAGRTADAFAERLRDTVAIDTLTADLASTVQVAIRPSTQALWLREVAR
jgi:hypothetical protein